jgi:hypothetical protein
VRHSPWRFAAIVTGANTSDQRNRSQCPSYRWPPAGVFDSRFDAPETQNFTQTKQSVDGNAAIPYRRLVLSEAERASRRLF